MLYNNFYWYQSVLIDGIIYSILLQMIFSTDIIVYIFFYFFFIYYLFFFALCKSFIFVLCILRCYVLILWATLAYCVLRLLNYTLVTFHCQKINNQNCRSVGKYGLSSADKQILSNGILERKPSFCFVNSSCWLFLSCQRPNDQKFRGIGKKSLFSVDEENFSGGV